jgi:hypothetical protein
MQNYLDAYITDSREAIVRSGAIASNNPPVALIPNPRPMPDEMRETMRAEIDRRVRGDGANECVRLAEYIAELVKVWGWDGAITLGYVQTSGGTLWKFDMEQVRTWMTASRRATVSVSMPG